MFQNLEPQPDDALLALIGLYRDDPRANKIDLGVGTYRDEAGGTPVFAAIKVAERLLTETQQTKAYLGPEGSRRFIELLRPIVFGPSDALGERLTGVQTPGGSGGLRLGAELIDAARPGARVLVGMPTWPNHRPVLEAAGLRAVPYRFSSTRRRKASASTTCWLRCRLPSRAMSCCCTAAATTRRGPTSIWRSGPR